MKLEFLLPELLLGAEADADPFSLLRDSATALRRGEGIMPLPLLLFRLSAERCDDVDALRCKSTLAVDADMAAEGGGR